MTVILNFLPHGHLSESLKTKRLGCIVVQLGREGEWVTAGTGAKEGGRQPGRSLSEAGFIINMRRPGWEEAEHTQRSRGAWHLLQPQSLAMLGTKVTSSGKASQKAPLPGEHR